ncbi:uncharacterized protein LOC128663302 [Bombina bombina]|uniref:uncharacterized protein LOC128663302 n=1 Tax=Bombina bombina TaxID=8345 RepID=UPI00235A5FC9|nr:uncharacterized protein LOC128663302 [Bombina bombina]
MKISEPGVIGDTWHGEDKIWLKFSIWILIFGLHGKHFGAQAVTPGEENVQKLLKQTVRWGWVNQTQIQKQDDYTCDDNTFCNIANVTVNPQYLWKPPSGQKYQPNYCLYNDTGTIHIQNLTTIRCAGIHLGYIWTTVQERIQTIQTLAQNSTTDLSYTSTEEILVYNMSNLNVCVCYNASEISNRNLWAQYIILINKNSTVIDPGNIQLVERLY